MLRFDRKQQNSVKQLSFNKKIFFIKTSHAQVIRNAFIIIITSGYARFWLWHTGLVALQCMGS